MQEIKFGAEEYFSSDFDDIFIHSFQHILRIKNRQKKILKYFFLVFYTFLWNS